MGTKIDKNGLDHHFSRRGFLKASAAACAVAAAPSVLTGCSPTHYPANDCLARFQGAKSLTGKKIFEPASFGPIKVKNRLVRSATSMMTTDEYGRPTQELLDVYSELSQGGVGTIMTGMYDGGVVDDDKFREVDMEIHRKVPQVIHSHGAVAIQQVSHRGSQIEGESDESLFSLNRLSDLELKQMVERFVDFIDRSKQIGFDGVQIHAAHGYLLSEFLSPAMNRRTDKWGGSTEKRFRMVGEIIKRAKQKNSDFPIFIKLNAYDFQKNGMREPEAIKIAKLLEKAGCDGIEFSCGVMKDGFALTRVPDPPLDALFAFGPLKDAPNVAKYILPMIAPLAIKMYTPLYNYNVCAASEIKKNVNIPVTVVGGIRTLSDMQTIVQNDLADFVSMSRPFIIDPGFANSLKNKNPTESDCINCGYCFIGVMAKDVRCYYGEVS